jgi:diguanylate cyclase (GGDEF)-like protein
MDTQTIVILAVAINVTVAAAAILIPWLAGRRARSAAARRRAALAATVGPAPAPLMPTAADVEGHVSAMDDEAPGAGAPWFPPRNMRSNGEAWANGDAPSNGRVMPGASRPPYRLDGPLDADTGLDVGAAWARWLAEEETRIRRFHRPATVVLVELAGLDRLADRLGPEAAERLIPPIATTMRREARATDHLARLSATRFAALLPETDEIRAINYVERVRSACDLWLASGAVALRLSMGWAEIGPNRSASVATADAETRLFAERQGPRMATRPSTVRRVAAPAAAPSH